MTDAVHAAVLGDERPNLQAVRDLVGADARANQFLASHDALGNATAGYDQGLQPRDRSLVQYRKQSRDARKPDISKNY